jgi:hypothetical protein
MDVDGLGVRRQTQGHVKKRKKRPRFLAFCRYLRCLYPLQVRIAIVADNFSPHLTTKVDTSVVA